MSIGVPKGETPTSRTLANKPTNNIGVPSGETPTMVTKKPIDVTGNKLSKIVAPKGTAQTTTYLGPGNDAANSANQINGYLTGDTTYQSQMAAINQALSDYQANEKSAENDNSVSYAQNQYDLGRQQTKDTQDQADDYAARGLYRSGVFGKAYGDLNADYASKESALDQARSSTVGGLQRDMSNYVSSQTLAKQQARQDAINRRALTLLQLNGGS